jgi:hypothetical protein
MNDEQHHGPALRYGPSRTLDILIVICVLVFSVLAYVWFLPAN